ncbi:hypothetical protein [uncultured Tenacibaculum sp.]|uniref:hypothetical protein n=1 Tax=uncultured Tenacibaculum sp. TaxID=174713 RepID=UPI0026278ECF|nr:hypothetical protein [uncultured Tenacibaculum sp.]
MFGWNKVFKTRSHYVFDYKPRYYDERKERLKKLEDKYTSEAVIPQQHQDLEDITITFEKGNLRNAWKKNKSSTDYNSTLRIAVIIAILFGIAAYILKFS